MATMLFQCDICGQLHKTEEYAKKCEESHITVKGIKMHVYNNLDKPKYPSEIRCEMSDGKVIVYTRRTGVR